VVATPEAGLDTQAVRESPYPDPGVSSSRSAAVRRSERSYDR
jgi:hypothetical protein